MKKDTENTLTSESEIPENSSRFFAVMYQSDLFFGEKIMKYIGLYSAVTSDERHIGYFDTVRAISDYLKANFDGLKDCTVEIRQIIEFSKREDFVDFCKAPTE